MQTGIYRAKRKDNVPTEPLKIESLARYYPKYEHVRCECGGIIGAYDRENFTCEQCGERYSVYQLNYDYIFINGKTGWMFPVIMRRDK